MAEVPVGCGSKLRTQWGCRCGTVRFLMQALVTLAQVREAKARTSDGSK